MAHRIASLRLYMIPAFLAFVASAFIDMSGTIIHNA
jgi:hypothetical protein